VTSYDIPRLPLSEKVSTWPQLRRCLLRPNYLADKPSCRWRSLLRLVGVHPSSSITRTGRP